MLKVGSQAPHFVARAADGRVISMRALVGTPLIMYFFHKAFTPNCTIETRGFRDNYEELQGYGYEVIGVSTDSEETQCRFAAKHEVSFPMIADHDRTVSRLYDVLWPLIPYSRRVTYVLDEQQTVLAMFRHEFQASKHLDEVLRFARLTKTGQTRTSPA